MLTWYVLGAAICINKLGIAMQGYKNGAVLLFRGTEMFHYISEWNGDYRYVFYHTRHKSVARMIDFHSQNKPYWREKKEFENKYGKSDDEADPPEGEGWNKAGPSRQASTDGGEVKGGKLKFQRENDDDTNDGGGRPAKKRKGNQDGEAREEAILASEDYGDPGEKERPPTKRAAPGAEKRKNQHRMARITINSEQ